MNKEVELKQNILKKQQEIKSKVIKLQEMHGSKRYQKFLCKMTLDLKSFYFRATGKLWRLEIDKGPGAFVHNIIANAIDKDDSRIIKNFFELQIKYPQIKKTYKMSDIDVKQIADWYNSFKIHKAQTSSMNCAEEMVRLVLRYMPQVKYKPFFSAEDINKLSEYSYVKKVTTEDKTNNGIKK